MYIRGSEIKIQQQSQDSDGIRIATIHSSKGLESPIIFLLDFDLEIDKAKVKFIWRETEDDILFFIKPSKNDSFDDIDNIIIEEYSEENKELLRLLYVGMTRPRDSLYIIGDENSKGSFKIIKEKINSQINFTNTNLF